MARRVARHLPVALLVVVALHQVTATRYGDLTPWKGGGFGMFASTDSPGNRRLSIQALEPGLRRELELPPGLGLAAERALAFPTRRRVEDLAMQIAEAVGDAGSPTTSVEITVWKAWPQPEPLRSASALVNPTQD